MRIAEIQLRAFGPFTDLNIVFKVRDGDFHVLYGRNEAGKSSTLRALKFMFFGIPHNSTDNFLHENSKLRIGGQVCNSDGSEIYFLRRKGNKNTLLDFNENTLDEAVLNKFLHGVDEELFSTLFGIDHDTLTRGGQNILQEGGELGQSLFSAGMGGTDLRAILQGLDDEAAALFRPRGQVHVINRAISDYAGLKKVISEVSLPGRKWLEHNRELEKALRERENISNRIKNLHHEKSLFERLQSTLPDIAIRYKWISELQELGDIIIVDDEFGIKRKECLDRLRIATDARERAVKEIEKLKNRVGQIIIPQGLIDQADMIADLYQQLGSHRKGLQDRGRLQGNVQQLSLDIEILLSEIKLSSDTEEYMKLRPDAALRAKIQDLGSKYQAFLDILDRADKDITKSEKDLAKAEDTLQSLDGYRKIDALKSAVSRAQKSGDLTLSLRDALKDFKSEEEQVRLDSKRLPIWSGSLEELEKVSVPSSETIDRFESTFQEILSKMAVLEDKEKEAHSSLSRIEQNIEAFRIAGAVPTEDELFQTRERRNRGWSLVLRSWIGKEAIEELSSAFDAENELPKAYEKSVAQADEVADRMRREADRVATNASLIVQQNGLQTNLKEIELGREDLKKQLSDIELEWNGHWKPTGMKPLSPKEMRAWSVKQSSLLQRVEKLRGLRQRCEQIAAQIEEHRAELVARLCELGQESEAIKDYDSLLIHCQSIVDSIEVINRKRVDLSDKIGNLEDEMKTLTQKREGLEKKFNKWQSDWKTTVSKLSLESQVSPAEAYAVLSKLDELFKKVDEKDSIERRITGIERDAGEFSINVQALVKMVVPEFDNLPVEQAVVQINSLSNEANENLARLVEMKQRLGEQEETLQDAEETIIVTLKLLQDLCMQTGCAKHEDLEEIERRSSRKRFIQEQIESIETRLLKIGGGLSVDELIKEAEEADADSLTGMISEIESQLNISEATRSELDQRIGSIQTILSQMDGNAKAAEAAEQSQQTLSSIVENVDRYIRFRMCSMVLNREIERYRTENQGPLLRRAGQLFSILTLASFSGLATGFGDNDEPVLVGVRPSGEKIGVLGMSDGTLDQLYLALRLASLEKFLDTNEPMPFIVDDILIRFDDERATAALKILADLSKKTQILFLTHHARLIELVQKESACGNADIHFL